MRLTVVAVLVGLLLSGCAAGGGVSQQGSCAAVMTFHGTTYSGWGDWTRLPRRAGSLGVGQMAACLGVGGQPVHLVALPGIDHDRAVMDTDDQFWIASGTAQVPAFLRLARKPVPCDWAGNRSLSGTWESVMGERQPRYDGDLNPPYHIGVIIDAHQVDMPRWRLVRVRINVSAETDPTLSTSDVKQALWTSGGTLTARSHCDEGRFVADAVTTAPAP
jgi:hypothetical protein